MNLNNLSKEIYQINKDKGFWTDNPNEKNIGEALMLVVSELSEALEADRHHLYAQRDNYDLAIDKAEKEFPTIFEKYIKNSFEDEIADAVIRLLDLCGGLNIDIQWHIEQKLKYNKTRPYKHGKKY